MSIWSSFVQVEPLREQGYGRDISPGSVLDLADTGINGRRGDLLRLWLCASARPSGAPIEDASAVLDRRQVIELRDHLTAWLTRCPGTLTIPDDPTYQDTP